MRQRQRLRKSRTDRQLQRPTASTSDAAPKLGVSAPHGHYNTAPKVSEVSALDPKYVADMLQKYPSATVRAVRRGSKFRADMISYVDPSRIEPK
jgi:hypothetical protein